MNDSHPSRLPNRIEPKKLAAEWVARQRARERRKIIGLLLIAFLILILAFVRFGSMIPWGAR